MRRTPTASWLLALVIGCATTSTETTDTAAEDAKERAAEAAVLAEMEEQSELEARNARRKGLTSMFREANLMQMPDDERSRVKVAAMAELAGLEFAAGDITAAETAIERAIEVAQVSGNKKIQASLVKDRLLIKRYAALETAKLGDLDESIAMLDKLMLISGLTSEQRQQIGGDKLMVMEMKGGGSSDETYRAALARMLGPVDKKAPSSGGSSPSMMPPGRMSSDDLRKTLGASIGRDVGAAALPSAGTDAIAETGRINQATILKVVSANKTSVAICYNRSLKSGERLRGKLEMSVTVEPKGTVSNTSVKTAKFKGTALSKCIAATVRRWRFPPFAGQSAEVVVPFVLSRTL